MDFTHFAQVANAAADNNTTTLIVFIANIIISAIVGAATAFFTIGRYKEKVDRVIDDQKVCDTKRTDMKTELDKLLEFKTQAQKFIDQNIYKDHSPLSLTEFGQKLVDESGFTKIFADVRDDLANKLEQEKPTSQYETQEKARALMDNLTDYEPFKPVETYAFAHGKDLGQILRAGAIMLRDYYFEKHPEIVDPKESW